MRSRTSVIILSLGMVGFVMMLMFYQQALESGLNLGPIVDLRENVREGFDVADVQVRRGTDPEAESDASEKNYRLIIEVRSGSEVRRQKDLARRVLRYAVNHYDGDRGPLRGIRVDVKPHASDAPGDTVTVKKRMGPPAKY